MENLSEQEIIKKVRAGQTELFGQLVQKYQNKIFGYIYKIVGHKEEAEDIVQETFIKVYKNLNSFDADRKFSSWLYRISHNEAINYIKKNKRNAELYFEDNDYLFNQLKYEKDLLRELTVKEDFNNLKKALAKLPLKYREVIVLKYLEEKSYEEIAKILKQPINTIGTRLRRAKKNLQELISQN